MLFCGCIEETTGSIYGVIVDASTVLPLRGAEISLWKDNSLLLKTVTYDDGHFQFDNLSVGEYYIAVEMSGYRRQQFPVIVQDGTARADMQIKALDTKMTVTTTSAEVHGAKVSVSGAILWSSGYGSYERGFVYGTKPMPIKGQDHTISANEITNGSFNVEFIPEIPGAYYVRAYAENKIGVTYGSDLKFETVGLPSITTLAATDIDTDTKTARLNARIDYKGIPQYHERGFVYSSSLSYPTLEDPESATKKVVVSGKSEEFSANITGLAIDKKYYARAYAINEIGVAYGEVVSFVESSGNYVIIDNLAVQCRDAAANANWTSAIEICKSSRIDGYSDWRLPTVNELSLIYVNKQYIGNFAWNGDYWSSSSYNTTQAKYIYFDGGRIYIGDKSYSNRVRCVRTIQ